MPVVKICSKCKKKKSFDNFCDYSFICEECSERKQWTVVLEEAVKYLGKNENSNTST